MSATLTWHGHSNVQINCPECSVIIDPFFTGNPTAKTTWNAISPPDVVLVTHLHGDHAGDAISICKHFKSQLGAVVGLADSMTNAGVPADRIINGIGFNIGGTVRVKGVSITMVDASHTSEAGTPTGFIITLPDGFTIYHAGDTGILATMELWGQLYDIDLALLPSGGVFTMDSPQAALAAKLLRAKAAIAMHWGTFPVLEQDTLTFAVKLAKTAPTCRFVDLKPGQTISLDTYAMTV